MEPPHRTNHPYIDLAELLAAPLTALIDADVYAAEAFAEFLRDYGFESSAGPDFGKLRMVTFSYSKAEPDGRTQTYQASIPLLALLPLPSLTIKDADVRFNVEVLGALERPAPPHRRVLSAAATSTPSVQPHRLFARIARTTAYQPPEEEEDLVNPEVHMKVRLNVVQGDLPAGVTQLLTMMASSTTEFQQRRPAILVQAIDGRTAFTGVGDTIELELRVADAAGTPQPGIDVWLSQDSAVLLQFPDNPVRTDEAGQAWAKVSLAQAAPEGTGKVFKTLNLEAIVPSKDGGSSDASGSIILEIPRPLS